MSKGSYSLDKKDYDPTLDLTRIKPYGDTMNDGKVQVSFTLPVADNPESMEAAKILAQDMGLNEPVIAAHKKLDENFTFYIIYGSLAYTVDYTQIHVAQLDVKTMAMSEVDAYIKKYIKRNVIVVGASTGTDAHTVGIDAIMNMKGYAGHYGLERYKMVDAYNLGGQVENEEFVKRAIELKADVLLVSQTVTQKNIHIDNLINLVEILEAEGLRDKVILICGGPRIDYELAKKLGYDAGFGPGNFAEDVATFMVTEIVKRN